MEAIRFAASLCSAATGRDGYDADMDSALRTLALDASVAGGSVTALVGEQVLAERVLAAEEKTARVLAPAIQQVLREAGWRPREIDLVAVGVGPGSFTGLRLAVTTAKSLAFALGKPLVGISTLRAIANQAPAGFDQVHAAMNGQRGELFVQGFAAGELEYTSLDEPTITKPDAWLSRLAALAPLRIALTGPGLPPVLEAAQQVAGLTILDPAVWPPRAATIGRLAHRDHLAGRRDDPFTLAPVYLRPSYAEDRRPASNEMPGV
jgi:tRNA threonylcarbamoyladenosine biosynthesis protein TsaB